MRRIMRVVGALAVLMVLLAACTIPMQLMFDDEGAALYVAAPASESPPALPEPLPAPAGLSRGIGDTNFTSLVTSEYMRYERQAPIAVTMNGTINPTGTYQPLTAAGNVGTSDLTVLEAGTLLILINESNTTITISDTGVLKLSSNLALGQYDAAVLISDGTNWYEFGASDN